MLYFSKIRYLIILLFLFYIAVTATSCTPQRKVIDTPIANGKFEFLQNGKTNKEEIIDRLGWPSLSYENRRIFVYWASDESKDYHIVIIFNEDDVLKNHSIVRVR